MQYKTFDSGAKVCGSSAWPWTLLDSSPWRQVSLSKHLRDISSEMACHIWNCLLWTDLSTCVKNNLNATINLLQYWTVCKFVLIVYDWRVLARILGILVMQLSQVEEWATWVYGNYGSGKGPEEAIAGAGLHTFLYTYAKVHVHKERRLKLQMSGCGMANFPGFFF